MSARQWWSGVAAIVVAVLIHGVLGFAQRPRYAFQQVAGLVFLKVDHTSGDASVVRFALPAEVTSAPVELPGGFDLSKFEKAPAK